MDELPVVVTGELARGAGHPAVHDHRVERIVGRVGPGQLEAELGQPLVDGRGDGHGRRPYRLTRSGTGRVTAVTRKPWRGGPCRTAVAGGQPPQPVKAGDVFTAAATGATVVGGAVVVVVGAAVVVVVCRLAS